MSVEIMRVISDFNSMPATEEKAKICRAYNNDEINTFDMVQRVKAYMKEVEK